ncbi:beta-1,3-glucosyltransferase isoform X2 [Bactrocera tryoni]|uniref:beta-1,3-glucosyltransferase isoform X2 n=1 Tax=Bactrocera tryoni TaxID=59916 RepID=UPI001A969FB0|nr:beta-1,3-glucosyltransferase isoform X2 [Bactrocera tryoni]
MYRILHTFVAVLLLGTSNISTEPTGVLFLISSQDTTYHRPLAARLRDDIINQAESQLPNTDYIITVHMLHEIFNFPSYWAIKNAIPLVRSKLLGEHVKWVVWLEESTHVLLQTLLEQLALEDATRCLYLGHALYDDQANIRHHFAFHKDSEWFPFPLQRAGIVFSRALIIKTAEALETANIYSSPFIIDMEHELALFIYNEVKSVALETQLSEEELTGATKSNAMQKVLMRKAHYICSRSDEYVQGNADNKCAMYAKPMERNHCNTVRPKNIFFAVKTCKRFHFDRIPIIKATWAPIASHIRYYSDVADPQIPTKSTGIPNTEIGHCNKTLTILKLALREIDDINRKLENLVPEQDENTRIHWLVLADDDTLLSIPNLCALLGCFNYTNDIYLGERYGFHHNINNGFNYITSGGGVAMSLPAVRKLLAHCHCTHPQDADDMLLGMCFTNLEVPIIHSQQFHQLRPQDYPTELLALDPPISFHKFYDLDPISVYNNYFANATQQMLLATKQISYTNQK